MNITNQVEAEQELLKAIETIKEHITTWTITAARAIPTSTGQQVSKANGHINGLMNALHILESQYNELLRKRTLELSQEQNQEDQHNELLKKRILELNQDQNQEDQHT